MVERSTVFLVAVVAWFFLGGSFAVSSASDATALDRERLAGWGGESGEAARLLARLGVRPIGLVDLSPLVVAAFAMTALRAEALGSSGFCEAARADLRRG